MISNIQSKDISNSLCEPVVKKFPIYLTLNEVSKNIVHFDKY